MNSARSLVRAIRGPILLIVAGALWLLERIAPEGDTGPGSPAGGAA